MVGDIQLGISCIQLAIGMKIGSESGQVAV